MDGGWVSRRILCLQAMSQRNSSSFCYALLELPARRAPAALGLKQRAFPFQVMLDKPVNELMSVR